MLEITTDKKGFKNIRDMLFDMKLRVEDVKEVAPLVHKAIERDVLARFEKSPYTQTGGFVPGNVYWRRLKKSTLRARPDRLNKKLLIDTTALMQSMKTGNPLNFADSHYKNIRFGSKLPYAHKQNMMRHYLFLHPNLMKEITNILKIYVKYGKESVKDMKHNYYDVQEDAFEDNRGVKR